MSGYLPHHREEKPDPLATLLAFLLIAFLVLCLVKCFADAIDAADYSGGLTHEQRKVIVDRQGEPQIVPAWMER